MTHVCSLCTDDFRMDEEGGMSGVIGILSFTLCSVCYGGMVDMVFELYDIQWDEDTMDDHHVGKPSVPNLPKPNTGNGGVA